MRRAVLEELRAARAARRQVVVVTWTDSGEQVLLWPGGPSHPLDGAAARVLARDTGEVIDTADGPVFLEPHNPPRRLLLVGAVHVAKPLSAMARQAGFEVTIVDPRTAFATEARFPDVPLITRWPDQAMAELAPDARTAVVTLTHDPKLDDPALIAALRSPAFYVGCLGSRKTHAARIERLTERGFDAAALGRLHGPVGLRIGAVSPAEIAVSILAEMVAVLHGADPTAPRPDASGRGRGESPARSGV